MSDHALSQEEIDALLRGETTSDESKPLDLEPAAVVFQSVLESIAPVVSPVAGQPCEAGRVTAELVPWEELKARLINPLVARLDFQGELQGVQLSVADGSTQQQLRALDDSDPATILNKIALALSAALEEKLGLQLESEISSYEPMDEQTEERLPWQAADECAVFNLSLQGPTGPIAWQEVLPRDLVTELIDRLPDEGDETESPSTPTVPPSDIEEVAPAPSEQVSAPAAEAQPLSAGSPVGGPVAVTPAQFAPLGAPDTEPHGGNIGLIMDVPLQVTVELGRKRMLVRDVLELGKGSLIELEKLAGEPVDVFVNGKLIAKGEVVVIDENFGVKVTSIVTPVERLQNLQ